MYKYAINPRGRKVRVEDKHLPGLTKEGFVEISPEEFNNQKYVKSLDSNPKKNVEIQVKTKETSYFKTRIV